MHDAEAWKMVDGMHFIFWGIKWDFRLNYVLLVLIRDEIRELLLLQRKLI